MQHSGDGSVSYPFHTHAVQAALNAEGYRFNCGQYGSCALFAVYLRFPVVLRGCRTAENRGLNRIGGKVIFRLRALPLTQLHGFLLRQHITFKSRSLLARRLMPLSHLCGSNFGSLRFCSRREPHETANIQRRPRRNYNNRHQNVNLSRATFRATIASFRRPQNYLQNHREPRLEPHKW